MNSASVSAPGEFVMKKVKVHLENCYGIKALDHTFDFEKVPAYAIYAPNGAMKSSFAMTFRDAQLRQQSTDRIFPDRATVRSIEDETGQQIEGDRILVVMSYDEEVGPNEQTCNLLVNPTLRDEYTKLHLEVDEAQAALLAALKAQSKSKMDIEAEISSAVMQAPNQFIPALRRIAHEVAEQDAAPFAEVPYDKAFEPKNMEALTKGKLNDALEDYVKRYDELLAASTYFKKGVFDYYHAGEIARSLAKNGFFRANHTVHLNYNGKAEEIKDEKDLEKVIQREKEAIFQDARLMTAFNKIEDSLNKNVGLRDFRDFLMENPAVLARMNNVPQLKQDVWKSYLKTHEDSLTDLLGKYEKAEKRRKEIEAIAANERTLWEEVIDIFNDRFVVPFKLQATNRVAVMLGGKGIELGFTYHDGADNAKVQKSDLLRVLSMGERRALYILNVLFEIRTRESLGQETLFVIDDIADSFDYQNKYAIIEYLKEISDGGQFKQIILTHNFDFFRTILNRNVANYPSCLMVQKGTQGITFKRADGIRNIFVNDWKTKFFEDDKKKMACIPFLRNLIEFTKGEDDPNYLVLTSMLHWRPDTPTLTVATLDGIYDAVCGAGGKTSPAPGRLIVDLIAAEAEKCAQEAGWMGLSDKVVLAMGIRLAAEKFMAAKIADPAFVAGITGHQTQELLRKFKEKFPTETAALGVLGRVALMTPENIHLNSFMYEPILDMSAERLCALHADVKALS